MPAIPKAPPPPSFKWEKDRLEILFHGVPANAYEVSEFAIRCWRKITKALAGDPECSPPALKANRIGGLFLVFKIDTKGWTEDVRTRFYEAATSLGFKSK